MRRPAIPLAVAAALALAGCGGTSPEDEVRATVTAFRDATAARDYAKICKEVLAPGLVRRLDDLGLPCETALARYLAGTRKPQITVERVRIDGRRARAFVSSKAEGQPAGDAVLGLVKTADGWRIATLGGAGANPAPSPGP